jgi:hypothetical protein
LEQTLVAIAPTCDEPGLTEGEQCANCGDILIPQQQVPALGHDFTISTVGPTCTDGGYERHWCRRCQVEVIENETEPLGHNLQVTTVAPTCTEAGWDLHSCTRCDYTLQNNETAPLGHHYGAWETIKEPTLEAEGLAQSQCSRCQVIREKSLDRLTPEPTEPVPTDPGEPDPTQPTATMPEEPNPTQGPTQVPTEPGPQPEPSPAVLWPIIILGAVLLAITWAMVIWLLRRVS